MNNLVIMKNQQAVTSSLQVAEVFDKNHQHVLRDIDNLKEGVQNWTDLSTKMFIHIPKINNNTELSI